MANHKTKLELTCIGKENQPSLEPRILVEDTEKSYHAKFRNYPQITQKGTDSDIVLICENLPNLRISCLLYTSPSPRD